MTTVRWNEVATNLATHARHNFFFLPRGAVPVRLVEDDTVSGRVLEEGNVIIGVFGNDNYLSDSRARQEVELIRLRLKETIAQEAGFGLSPDGYSWALIVKADTQKYRTAVARAFHRELLKASLEDAVEQAWQKVAGVEAECVPPVF
jgi:hypothetical protein